MTSPYAGWRRLKSGEDGVATGNTALIINEAIASGYVIDDGLNTPPSTPADGDTYIIGSSPTGDWATHANKLTVAVGGIWEVIFTPRVGHVVSVRNTNSVAVNLRKVWDGTNWVRILPDGVKSISVASPGASEDQTIFYTEEAITIQELNAVLVGGSSPSVTWTIRHGSDRTSGTEVVTSGTTTTTTTTAQSVTTFNDATIPADRFVWIETTASSGSPTELHVTARFTRDAEY